MTSWELESWNDLINTQSAQKKQQRVEVKKYADSI